MNFEVWIVGDDGINTLGLVRSLGEQGVYSNVLLTGLKNKVNMALKSKYIANYIVIEKQKEKIIEELLRISNCTNKEKFLFPTSDYVLSAIGDSERLLSEKFHIPQVKNITGGIKAVLSKAFSAKWAGEAGILIPKLLKYFVENRFKSDETLYKYFKNCFPVILKSESIDNDYCNFEIANDEQELCTLLEKYVNKTIIIQEYIENAVEMAVQGVGFGNERCPMMHGMIVKKRTSIMSKGTTTYAELCDFKDIRLKQMCISFAEIVGIDGIFDLDILEKDGKYYFIECNFRNGSNGYAYTRFGLNLPYVWILGKNNQDIEIPKYKNINFMSEIGDFYHVLHGDINIFKWLVQFITAKAYLTWNFKDQKPFWAEFNIKRLRKVFHKK